MCGQGVRLFVGKGCGILLTGFSTAYGDNLLFEFERYVHDINNYQLLSAYLDRVSLRIEMCKVYYGIG